MIKFFFIVVACHILFIYQKYSAGYDVALSNFLILTLSFLVNFTLDYESDRHLFSKDDKE